MNTTLPYYSLLLTLLISLVLLCIPMVFRYTSRFLIGTSVFLVLSLLITSISIGPFISNYGEPDSQNWKFEARAEMLNEGLHTDQMRHPFGYIFLLSTARYLTGNDPSVEHTSAMVLNAILFTGSVIIIFIIALVLFDNIYAALTSGIFYALMSKNWYECLSCEHRIASTFFVLLMILSIIALSRKKSPLLAGVFLLSAIWAIEVRIENVIYYGLTFVFILLNSNRFSKRHISFFVFVYVLGGCMIALIPSFFNTGGDFFKLSFFMRDIPALKSLLLENPIIPAVCMAGLWFGFKRHLRTSAFLIFWFVGISIFWAAAATVTMHREIVYLYAPMALMFGLAIPMLLEYLSSDRTLQKIIISTITISALGFFINQVLHRPDIIQQFAIRQEYDRDIREYLEQLPEGYTVLLRSEYTYAVAPNVINPMPLFDKLYLEELGYKLEAMTPNGIMCFSELSSEYDCQFFELWKRKNDKKGLLYDEDINCLDFDQLGLDGVRTEHRGKYLKAVSLKL